MKYSEMTPVQRKLLLDDEENYPLRVTFLGKDAIHTKEQLDFLREHQINFDVDDDLAAAVLGRQAVEQARAERVVHRLTEEVRESVQETVETVLPPERRRELQQVEGEAVGGIAGIFAAALRLLRRILRL